MTYLLLWLVLAVASVAVVVLARRVLRLIEINRTTEYWVDTITRPMASSDVAVIRERSAPRRG